MPRMNGATYCRQAASMEDLMDVGEGIDAIKPSSSLPPDELNRRIELYGSRFDAGLGIFDGQPVEDDDNGEEETDIES